MPISNQGPVARWLETIQFKQYMDVFERYGYTTLEQVCILNTSVLLSMGVNEYDCDRIMESVCILRQTLQACSNNASFTAIDQFEQLTPSTSVTTKTTKKKSKSSDVKTNNTNISSSPPNVTINTKYNQNTQLMYSNAGYSYQSNPEAAKQIANDILTYTKQTNMNAKYTCIPLNSSSSQYNNNNNNMFQQAQTWDAPQTNYYMQKTVNSPLESLERLVSLPESQVIDPKSVVSDNEISPSMQYPFDYTNQQQQAKINLKRSNNIEGDTNNNNEFYMNQNNNINKKLCQPLQQQQQQPTYYYSEYNNQLQQSSSSQIPQYLSQPQTGYFNQQSYIVNNSTQYYNPEQPSPSMNEYHYQNNNNNSIISDTTNYYYSNNPSSDNSVVEQQQQSTNYLNEFNPNQDQQQQQQQQQYVYQFNSSQQQYYNYSTPPPPPQQLPLDVNNSHLIQ